MKRRDFVKTGALGSAIILMDNCVGQNSSQKTAATLAINKPDAPKVISTWSPGLTANKSAIELLSTDYSAVDAVEKSLNIIEADPQNTSVGIGGIPDENGIVTLDACIMDHEFNCGSVTYLQDIINPISVARMVMEKTPHVILSGKGAYDFAIKNGFKHSNLLTDNSYEKWMEWKKENTLKKPIINHENHDTIAMIAMDKDGKIAAGCTTSGWAYKVHGRVGDSPIIGAGIYVDPDVGAACATGLGEAVIKICGSHTIVELMRNGLSPKEACENAINRIKRSNKSLENLQVGFLAMNSSGEVGSHSMYSGFQYASQDKKQSELINSTYEFEW